MRDYVAQNSFLAIDANKKTTEYSVTISDHSQSFCVGLVDIVNSTKITANLSRSKIGIYYESFLNSMGKVLDRFGAVTIKNIGDSLLFFFPESSHSDRRYGFMNCLECLLAMVDEHDKINEKLLEDGLPSMDYRISADYGSVSIMRSNDNSFDLIGPSVNVCAKINHQAPVNGVIIGGDLYQITKSFAEYSFKQAEGFSVDFKLSYPTYSVRRKRV